MPAVELIYEYMHQVSLMTRSEFGARFDAPVLLFRRVPSVEETASTTRIEVDTGVGRVAAKLAARNLQLRKDAHTHRIVRLPAAGRLTVGRSSDNDITLPHKLVSKHHLLIECEPGVVRIVDLGSSNGTFVDEQRVGPKEPRLLNVGEEVRLGGVQLRVFSGFDLYDALGELTQQAD